MSEKRKWQEGKNWAKGDVNDENRQHHSCYVENDTKLKKQKSNASDGPARFNSAFTQFRGLDECSISVIRDKSTVEDDSAAEEESNMTNIILYGYRKNVEVDEGVEADGKNEEEKE